MTEPIFHDELAISSSAQSIADSLLFRLKSQDEAAWEQLHYLYQPVIFGWLRAAGIDEADAADVSQEVMQNVWRKISDFQRDKPGATFRGWLWTITRNRVRDLIRSKKLRISAVGGSEMLNLLQNISEEADDFSTCPAATLQENHELVRRAISLVKRDVQPKTWAAFWATVVELRLATDVAAELGISIASVYTAKSRVLSRLRECLGDDALRLITS